MMHVVGLSGGKDSTHMALELAEREPRDYVYVCTPTGNELPEMVAHWVRLQELLGSPLIPVVAAGGLEGLIQRFKALPNWRQRWCTRILKIEGLQQWLIGKGEATIYIGLRADEEADVRVGGDYSALPGVTVDYPLRRWGHSLRDVRAGNERRGISIPERTDCAWCFFQRLGEWYRLWRDHPTYYAEGEKWEAFTGFTFRSPGRDSWPHALKDLRAEFERGRIPKSEWKTAANSGQCRVCSL